MFVDPTIIIGTILPSSYPEFVTFFGTLILIFIYSKYIYSEKGNVGKFKKLPPGPKSYPIIGNVYYFLQFPLTELNKEISKLRQIYGPVYRLWGFHRAFVLLSSPKDVEKILSSSSPQLLDKTSDYWIFKPWLGNALNVAKSHEWFSKRKLLSPGYHLRFLNGFMDVLNEESILLKKLIEKDCLEKESVDLYPYMARCTLDIYAQLGTGCKISAQTQADSKYFKASVLITNLMLEHLLKPWLFPELIWKLSPQGRKEKECIKILHGFVENAITERKNKILNKTGLVDIENYKMRSSFLDYLILASQGENILTDKEIRDECSVFMLGGDTSGTATCWVLHHLARHPEIQKKVHEELDRIFDKGSHRHATESDIQQLKYLDLCIKEALRLTPPVPFVARHIYEDTYLSDNMVIPAGETLILHISELHRDPSAFPEPLKYDPDRFLPENCTGRSPYQYIPFSAGPRNCLGKSIGHMKMKVLLSTLLRDFKISTTENFEDIVMSLASRPVNGLHFTVIRRT